MGRLARAVLREAARDSQIELTLLCARAADARRLGGEFPGARVRWPITAASRGAFHAVWYPFNGMRFPSAAPAVVTMHDVFAFSAPHRELVARFREQSPIRRAARDAALVVTDSYWSRDEIVRELGIPFARVEVIHPMPDPFWMPAAGDVLPAGIEGRRFALLVAPAEARKNARTALEACSRALARERRMLVVVGALAGADRAFARAQHIECGEIAASDALLRALYRRATAVLVPSSAEGFGMVAAEALACGAPVISSNATALPEAVAGAAIELDPRDVSAWARTLESIFDDGALEAQLRERALARYAGADRSCAARRTLTVLRDEALFARGSIIARRP